MKAFKLDEHPKINTGFKVPDGYFDGFTDHMLMQLNDEPKVLQLHRRKTWIFAAAAILVLSMTIPIINKVVETDQPDEAAIENYLAYHATIADEDIVELLEKEDISNIKIDYRLEDTSIEEALPTDIENYILD